MRRGFKEICGFDTTLQDEVDEAKLINEDDWEANIAYYCLHELHILPSKLFALDRRDLRL